MEITLLGTGTPTPSAYRQCAANLIRIGDDYLLFDVGRAATTQMARIGVTLSDLGFIFITHHHFDHIGSLGDVILASWISGRKEAIRVFGPEGTADIVHTLLNRVYARDIEYRLKESQHLHELDIDIRDIVFVQDVGPGQVYETTHWQVISDFVEHGHAFGLTQEEWPCMGYRLESEGRVVAISGDAVECESLYNLAHEADVLIQCCYLSDAEITNHDRAVISRYVLASATQAGRIAARAGVKRLVLTHLKTKLPEMLRAVESDVRQHFRGELIVGEDLLRFAI